MYDSLTVERLQEVLHYDPATGVWTWLKTLSNVAAKGKRAGVVGPIMYRVIGVDGTRYRSSRLAYLYMTGEWPSGFIDHKNMDTVDDRWSNLRLATRSQNNANTPARRTNKSGYKGVSWDRESACWVAFIQANGKRRYLGRFKTKEAAYAQYCQAAHAAFGEYARVA